MMSDTDWREILSFSQKELIQADKEKLCESLSWMEADDIELNFSDLKTLFRLSQDILKFKSEQVHTLKGQLEIVQRKVKKSMAIDSPTKSSDSILETIAHQEEVIKANKEVLEQLYADIAELEGKRNKLDQDRDNIDKESESSRDLLSEINEVAQLQDEITLKNRHIRKLLSDVKVLEEENTKLKEKLSILKDKLTEATNLIENLTEQLNILNYESTQLKDLLGKTEESKSHLNMKIEMLTKELSEKTFKKDTIYTEIKTKAHHWKSIARSKKAQIEALSRENNILKESLTHFSQSQPASPSKNQPIEEQKLKELQLKLSEASEEIEQSANLIEELKAENKHLKSLLEESVDIPISETRNESDDNKERILNIKLKKKVKSLSVFLQKAEEMITERDKELADTTSQLQLVQSDDGIRALLEGLKYKKRQLQQKENDIKTLVQEINNLNQLVDDLQLENESLRQKFHIAPEEKISTKGVVRKYKEMEQTITRQEKMVKCLENQLTESQLDNHVFKTRINKMTDLLKELGCSDDKIKHIILETVYNPSEENDSETIINSANTNTVYSKTNDVSLMKCNCENEMQKIVDENEGLRKGLQEILNFLKDNSTTSSGILSLECPSLDAILQSMEARHTAGWFAPHMGTIMELRATIGGRDALLTALHEARKETFDVMSQLSKESQKTQELQEKIQEMEITQKAEMEETNTDTGTQKEAARKFSLGEYGSWISFNGEDNIDFNNTEQIENLITNRNVKYENYLKRGLGYFHEKFKYLFEKMTSIVVHSSDQQNKWSIQEEQYRATIENLKGQLVEKNDDDYSETSPGLIGIPTTNSLQRKCLYLEESYKYIRTLNENLKNEVLESKKESLLVTLDYETQTQNLMLAIANLFDKLRCSIPMELFWKQNTALNNAVENHRKFLENTMKEKNSIDFYKYLEKSRNDLINQLSKYHSNIDTNNTDCAKDPELVILKNQLKETCTQLASKNKDITCLESKIFELQENQRKLIDESLASSSQEEVNYMNNQLKKLTDENKLLNDQCQHLRSQLEIALVQLQDGQQRQLNYDIEINMLRHQILDLQSLGDNKAIIARLSGEVLVAHLQASESHKKIDRLTSQLNKEKQSKVEAEEMLKARQNIFDIYASRYESKFRYMYEVMQVLRQQYHGSLPIVSIENYLNKLEELNRKTHAASEKLQDIEDLQYSLMTKHSVFDQIFDLSRNKCQEVNDGCSHRLKNMVIEGIHSREEIYYKKKIESLELSNEDLKKYCNELEKTLLLVNQGIDKSTLNVERKNIKKEDILVLELEDVKSDDESNSRKSRTVTLEKPPILPTNKPVTERDISHLKEHNNEDKNNRYLKQSTEINTVFVQTISTDCKKDFKYTQTDIDQENVSLKSEMEVLKSKQVNILKELNSAIALINSHENELNKLNMEKNNMEATIGNLKDTIKEKGTSNKSLRNTIEDLRKENEYLKSIQANQSVKLKETVDEEKKCFILALKNFENDKNQIVTEYQELLNIERNEYSKSMKELSAKISELQLKLNSKDSDMNSSNAETIKEVISKYTVKIAHLEDKSFKAQSELDCCRTELVTYQSEVDRWKALAFERLAKMEQLNSQLEERHCHEVESYKAENQHWLSQLNDSQREHLELRTRLTEQKTLHIKQLADKDAIIEQLRSAVHNLKTQIISMQTMISVNDPSFDLSAIVEVDESSDVSHQGSDRLEIKFDTSVELQEIDDMVRVPASSTAIWQEPVIERLRQEKQQASKQNAMLRRQIKALAARERRARLDAHNLKNQMFRISTSGSKAATAESAALQSKIASLQAQLTSARRDTHSSIALWDKWKRAQQNSDRWQTRYEEKCQEVQKLEASLNLAKSGVVRLEKEKRLLLSRLTEIKNEKQLTLEKQDNETPEKSFRLSERDRESVSPPPVSMQALLDRVQAQQRRIAALEVAEKGNEILVSEYERALAEITSLKGQVLKLESTLLEAQIRTPLKTTQDTQPELDYWKSYCVMLKEENVQLNVRVNALESAPASGHHRVSDLEQTVLSLRGLVSKLQAEQKSSVVQKRVESRPGSAKSIPDRNHKVDTHRIEIANLKRSLQDKDLLLEKSKEMLKIAAEREDELLRENTYLHRRIEELTNSKGGFLSA